MSNVITLQPNRLSMKYSAGKQSEEDLIKPDETDHQEPNTHFDKNGGQEHQEPNTHIDKNGEGQEHPEAGPSEEPAKGYNKEETLYEYMASICHCSSWLCANLVNSIVLCFENCIDFVHTCKCNQFCCDVCGGSEDDPEDRHEVTDEKNNDVSGTYEDEYIVCEYELDCRDLTVELPDPFVVVKGNQTSDTDGEKIKDMSNNQNHTQVSEDKKKSWI